MSDTELQESPKKLENKPKEVRQKRRPAEEQRRALLDAATQMLLTSGPDGISLRKLAKEAGLTTMAIYTQYGNKDGVLHALYEEAFLRLALKQEAVPNEGDPLNWLRHLGRAYRAFAIENPAYFALMIRITEPQAADGTQADPQQPTPAREIAAQRSFQSLLAAITVCQEADILRTDVATQEIADALWAVVNGLTSLEMAGYYATVEDAENRFALTAGILVEGFYSKSFRDKQSTPPET